MKFSDYMLKEAQKDNLDDLVRYAIESVLNGYGRWDEKFDYELKVSGTDVKFCIYGIEPKYDSQAETAEKTVLDALKKLNIKAKIDDSLA